jgi:phenylpropionate dioxygenase-like ring-hydroxylating dioxygenase large terminal subunit
MSLAAHWYVVADSAELRADQPLARELFGEWLVLFRDANGNPVALEDRCRHRAGRLSKGKVAQGCLTCPYHGWVYDRGGDVVAVPSEGPTFELAHHRRARVYAAAERDGYVYVRVDDPGQQSALPVPRMPNADDPAWHRLRLVHDFESTLADCVENFIDIPHTVTVHPGIFRVARNQPIDASIRRTGRRVEVTYEGETDNLGWFSRFLNRERRKIVHRDVFEAPNRTEVSYELGPRRRLIITSQSVPIREGLVRVYTQLTYDYGLLSRLAAPILAAQARTIIAQDIEVLREQARVVARYGRRFMNTPADRIHVQVQTILRALERGRDPEQLPERCEEVRFWV